MGLALTGSGENWPQWRGPFFNGTTSETNLPAQWSSTENVAWVKPLPGKSGATPIIWGDSVFVPSPDAQKNILLFCLSRLTGEVKWQKVVATGDAHIGVIATPAEAAQDVCDRLVAAGLRSILNFAPVVLTVPDDVEVRKVDLAVELQILAFHEQRRNDEASHARDTTFDPPSLGEAINA